MKMILYIILIILLAVAIVLYSCLSRAWQKCIKKNFDEVPYYL